MREDFNPFRQLEKVFDQSQLMNPSHLMGNIMPEMTLDIEDYEDEFVITADIPGYGPDDVDLTLNDETLFIVAEKTSDEESESESDDGTYLYRERSDSRMERQIPIPSPIEPTEASSVYSNGVLTVTIPKADPVEPEDDGTSIDIN